MDNEIVAYLIGLIPSLSVIAGLIPVVIKIFSWLKSIIKRDNTTQDQVKELAAKVDELLKDNAALRKENLQIRRQNNKLMTKITNVYIPEDKE